MPTIDWLKQEFDYGYDSGDVLSLTPNETRIEEEKLSGASYGEVFLKAVAVHLKPDAKVLELGPGKGSWSRAILRHIPEGELQVVDFQDVKQWLQPQNYQGRLICHLVQDNSFSMVPDNYFDFFWSFGVLCHNNIDNIAQILKNALPKVKPGGLAVHQYGDWNKLDDYGWEKGGVPVTFQQQPDDQIWWPRNNRATMNSIAQKAGWSVITADLGLVKRDSIIVLRRLP
ncbi:class I SAM-dependent methyltransferase [Crocosphaera sp.]|uniref:class I SAM-dependent methyltransferase n=1 Tax=Crocosphaera sp. TaxID=2729996 RepID=UPI002611B161|nr:class I SAM-dependent methyltransferase [Crocosphaera sp.]MDJ0579616.1 class I SAM-dependent methyltransferase [Crocosphaera sp.]